MYKVVFQTSQERGIAYEGDFEAEAIDAFVELEEMGAYVELTLDGRRKAIAPVDWLRG